MQEKLSRTEPLNFGSSQEAKRFLSLPVQTSHGIFHAPSRTSVVLMSTSHSGAKHKPTTSSCPVPPVRARGCLGTEWICHGTEPPPASGKCRAGNCFAPKQQAKTHWAFTDFISRPKNRTRPFCLEIGVQVPWDLTVPNVQG